MGTIWKNNAGRFWSVIWGYNFPFLLWTAFALFRPLTPIPHWSCPLRGIFSFCPGCGLTTAYTQLLLGSGVQEIRLVLVLLGFAANFAWSVFKAFRTLDRLS